MNNQIQILDSTLREGEQTPGVYFDNHIKKEIADILNSIGVGYIEAGHPLVSDEICTAVRDISRLNLNSIVVAHARSQKKDIDMALQSNVGMIGIFYCVSDKRLNDVFNVSLTKAIDQIVSTITYAKEQKPDILIRYTPEDTVRSKFQNVVDASVAAVEAGADIISVADTTGYMIPGVRSMYDYISRLRDALSKHGIRPTIAAHCHNDRGLALANSLDAVRAGANIIDASVLRLGERTGITDLAEILFNLTDGFHLDRWDLPRLQKLYELVSNYTGIGIPVNYPIVGENAFTHNAGVHTHAWIKKNDHYESVQPEIVGRTSKICLDNMSGLASVIHALERISNAEIDIEMAKWILKRVKEIGLRGRAVKEDELNLLVKYFKSLVEGHSAA